VIAGAPARVVRDYRPETGWSRPAPELSGLPPARDGAWPGFG
jgi:hypothetical protein